MFTRETHSTLFLKISSALFFGITSFLITVVNKIVLTNYNFPSFIFLGLGQLTASLLLLFIARLFKWIEFPNINENTFKEIFPLPFLFIGNMLTGLGGTQSLSLPMFTALRRISIFLTLILEMKMMGFRPGWIVHTSVFSMILGAFVAAVDDLSFKLEGYIYIMVSNIFTALYQVYIKKKLNSKKMNKYGLMFYNSLFSMIPTIIATQSFGHFKKIWAYDKWDDPWFLSCFIMSCVMGFLLTFSTFLCTFYNSALNVAMVGSIKNVFVTFVGMFIGGDYIFSILNCVGLSISALGSVLYTYASFMEKGKKTETVTKQDVNEESATSNQNGSQIVSESSINCDQGSEGIIGSENFGYSKNTDDEIKDKEHVTQTYL